MIKTYVLRDKASGKAVAEVAEFAEGQIILRWAEEPAGPLQRYDDSSALFMMGDGFELVPTDLTINGLVEMAYGTATANAWHDRKGELINTGHPMYLLAGLTPVKIALAEIVEAIRKPNGDNLARALAAFGSAADQLHGWDGSGIMHSAGTVVVDEVDKPIDGSKTQMLAWLHLIDSESAEAMQAVLAGDRKNFAEELAADIPIRVGDAIGAINDYPGHFLGPIDLEAEIQAKNERNRQRGYRHGGKQA